MKKFLIFLVSLVVMVCVGLTTYYFMRNNEVITIKTKEIYCNAGDVIPLKSLGINIEKANVSKKTQFNYNAGGEEVEQFIKFDEETQSFIVSQEHAGEVTLVISTTNKKYADFTISVHIGDGSLENPYFIFSESELLRIGSTYRLDKHYKLMNNINLTSNFSQIGFNKNTESWEGFSGSFDGQGYSIKGLNIENADVENAGLFSSLNQTAVVKNLTIENARISGSYKNAGILAGTIAGNVEKVVVKNSSLTNTRTQSFNGSISGVYSGKELKLSYSDNVSINVGTEEIATEAVVGGLVGKLNESVVQACYTNNVSLNVINSNAVAGGLVGGFVIGTETGSIQQSYANTISSYENFGAFVGEIATNETYDKTNANMLRHLIGNIAIVYGAENASSIEDSDLVNKKDNEIFVNSTYVDRSAFFDKNSALYLIRGYSSASEVISTNEFIYYAVDMNTITSWDTTYVWNTSNNSLPTLRMGNIYPAMPSGEYFRRNLAQKDMGNKETFVSTFSSDVKDANIKILEDIDLSNGWTPVSVSNTTIDGNNKTITLNLNNAVGGNLGLFTIIDNSTIKNLNIVIVGVSANSTNAGALAGTIISTDALASSSIENVNITYQNFATPIIANFGGVAGTIENTIITNSSVNNLQISKDAQIENAGAFVAEIKTNSQIVNSLIQSSTVVATNNVGGVTAINAGTISNVSGSVDVVSKLANAGGVVAINKSNVSDVTLEVNVTIEKTKENQQIATIVAVNDGTISNVSVSGDAIAIAENNSNKIYVAGLVATNNGTLENSSNHISTVGTYYAGANHYVAGVVAVNNGNVSKILSTSSLNGNYVSGVVAQMNKAQATIDQVVVGKYNSENKTLAQNEIKGDKYIAGIIVDFKAGKITNVQASSNIIGQTNSTRSSLVALIFQYGSSLKNATINSSLSGYGTKYREVWTDFASYTNKSEFNLENSASIDGRFNLYLQDVHHGSMQSVVINSANSGVSSATVSMGGAFAFGKDYQDTSDSSFVKLVNGFSSYTQFQGNFEFVCAKSVWLGIEHKTTKTLTFSIGDIWESNNGISLKFLNEIK